MDSFEIIFEPLKNPEKIDIASHHASLDVEIAKIQRALDIAGCEGRPDLTQIESKYFFKLSEPQRIMSARLHREAKLIGKCYHQLEEFRSKRIEAYYNGKRTLKTNTQMEEFETASDETLNTLVILKANIVHWELGRWLKTIQYTISAWYAEG